MRHGFYNKTTMEMIQLKESTGIDCNKKFIGYSFAEKIHWTKILS